MSATNVRVEGIAVENGRPLLVHTMDYIFGEHPIGLHERLVAEGWEIAADLQQMLSYQHKADGTLMRDAHPKNFIVTPANRLVPIDVIFA